MRRMVILRGIVVMSVLAVGTMLYSWLANEYRSLQTDVNVQTAHGEALNKEMTRNARELEMLRRQLRLASEKEAEEHDAKVGKLVLPTYNPGDEPPDLVPSVTIARLLEEKTALSERDVLDAFDVWVLFRADTVPAEPVSKLRRGAGPTRTPLACADSTGVAVQVGVVPRLLVSDAVEDGQRVAGMIIGRAGLFPTVRSLIQGFQLGSPGATLFVLDESLTEDETQELNLFQHVRVIHDELAYVRERFAAAGNAPCETTRVRELLRFVPVDGGPACEAQMEAPFIVPMRQHVPASKPIIAMCVLVYHSKGINSITELALVRRMFPTFLRSIRSSLARFDFRLYLGIQPQPFFDDNNRANVRLLRDTLLAMAEQEQIPLDRLVTLRYPLNTGLIDIAFKWNALISDAYADGADWFYQFSDDTELRTNGWADYVVDCINSHGGLGTGGAIDTNNRQVLTLSFAGRKHLELFGTYWPNELKNWYSDNWAEKIYGSFLCTRSDVTMFNTQQNGQRYATCHHEALFYKVLHRGYYRVWAYAASHQAELQAAASPITPDKVLAITDGFEAARGLPCWDRAVVSQFV